MSSFGFLIIIVAFGFLWLVLVRPQKRRQVEQRRMIEQLAVGDEVLTAGGIYGRVTEIVDEEITVEIAEGVRVRVARRAIAGVTPEPLPGEEDEDGDGGEDDDGPGEADELPAAGPATRRDDG